MYYDKGVRAFVLDADNLAIFPKDALQVVFSGGLAVAFDVDLWVSNSRHLIYNRIQFLALSKSTNIKLTYYQFEITSKGSNFIFSPYTHSYSEFCSFFASSIELMQLFFFYWYIPILISKFFKKSSELLMSLPSDISFLSCLISFSNSFIWCFKILA